MAETGLRDSLFPHNCPYTADQILSQEWLPKSSAALHKAQSAQLGRRHICYADPVA